MEDLDSNPALLLTRHVALEKLLTPLYLYPLS